MTPPTVDGPLLEVDPTNVVTLKLTATWFVALMEILNDRRSLADNGVFHSSRDNAKALMLILSAQGGTPIAFAEDK